MNKRRPSYTAPPVVEVVLGVQFDPIQGLTGPHVGLFWERFRDEYPKVQDQPVVKPVIERFDEQPKAGRRIEVELVEKPPLPRFWFYQEGMGDLIQLQQDRLWHNWRKTKDEDEYPRFQWVRDAFEKDYDRLSSFLSDEGLGELSPNQCEATYVNILERPETETGSESRLETALSFLALDAFGRGGRPDLEEIRGNLTFLMGGGADGPAGRVRVSFQPAIRKSTSTPVIRLELTARGRPRKPDLPGVLDFVDTARDWLSEVFETITTEEAQIAWGKE